MSTCCTPAAQAVCCDPAEKAACCDTPSRTEGSGCGCPEGKVSPVEAVSGDPDPAPPRAP